MSNLIVILALILITSPSFAAENSMSIKAAEVIDEETTEFEFKPSLGLKFGSSDNVGRLAIKTNGSYSKINPSIAYEHSVGDATVINSHLSLDLKKYSDKAAALLGDEESVEFRNTAVSFLTDSLELGGDLGISQVKNSIPIQVSDSETGAISQAYYEPEARIYLAFNLSENLLIEQGVSAKSRKNSNELLDRGNSFYNDFVVISGDLKLNYAISPSLKVILKAMIEDKKYNDKPADFTDGAASTAAAPNPALQELSNEYQISIESEIGKIKFVTTPAYRMNKDKIFGARDSKVVKFQQKVILTINSKLSWSPTISLSEESFSQFRADPESNPFGGELRRESETKISSPLKYSINSRFQLIGDYASIKKISNYANSSYSEQVFSAGLNLSL